MAYTSEQLRLARQIVNVGKRKGATKKEIKAALETAIVESNISNPSGGDADSAGWRQERASFYPDPTNVQHSAERFFNETAAVRHKYGRAGDLAAAVQRPAAQYRGRYQKHSADASALLRQLSGGGGGSRETGGTGSTTTYTPGIDNSATRRQLAAQYLLNRGQPGALPALVAGMRNAQDTPGTFSSIQTSSPALPTGGKVGQLKAAADLLDAAKMPYKWGGGHGKKLNLLKGGKPIPVDCSGAVSAVLGINPRVSGDFAKWGQAGKGKRVTIYANDEHVLMEINGHFFGTSQSNRGGGAGWIPRSKISKEYLSRFVARHPPGL